MHIHYIINNGDLGSGIISGISFPLILFLYSLNLESDFILHFSSEKKFTNLFLLQERENFFFNVLIFLFWYH